MRQPIIRRVVIFCSVLLGLVLCWVLLLRVGQRVALRNRFVAGRARGHVVAIHLWVPGRSVCIRGRASVRAIQLAFQGARPGDPHGVFGTGIFRFRSGRGVRLNDISISRCGRGFCLYAWTTYWFGGEDRPYRAKVAWPVPKRLAVALSSLIAARTYEPGGAVGAGGSSTRRETPRLRPLNFAPTAVRGAGE